MFISDVFIVVQNWKLIRCPSTNEWINKIWYIPTTDYYSVIGKQPPVYATTRMNLNQRCTEEVQTNDYILYDLVYLKF